MNMWMMESKKGEEIVLALMPEFLYIHKVSAHMKNTTSRDAQDPFVGFHFVVRGLHQ